MSTSYDGRVSLDIEDAVIVHVEIDEITSPIWRGPIRELTPIKGRFEVGAVIAKLLDGEQKGWRARAVADVSGGEGVLLGLEPFTPMPTPLAEP